MNMTSVPDGPSDRTAEFAVRVLQREILGLPAEVAGWCLQSCHVSSLASERCRADNGTLTEAIVLEDRLAYVPRALEPAREGHQIARAEFYRLAFGRGHFDLAF